MLRRHVASGHGLSPEKYRARWDLPRDHAMTAPAYSERRPTMANQLGLGRGGRRGLEPATPESQPPAWPGLEPIPSLTGMTRSGRKPSQIQRSRDRIPRRRSSFFFVRAPLPHRTGVLPAGIEHLFSLSNLNRSQEEVNPCPFVEQIIQTTVPNAIGTIWIIRLG